MLFLHFFLVFLVRFFFRRFSIVSSFRSLLVPLPLILTLSFSLKKKGSLFLTLSVTGFTVIFYFCYWPTPHAMFYIFHIHDTEFSVFFCFARFISMLIDGRFVHGLSDHHHYYHRFYIHLFLVYVFFSPHSLSLSLSLAIVCLVFLMLHALRSLCMFLCLHFAFTGAHFVRICKSVFFFSVSFSHFFVRILCLNKCSLSHQI